MNYPILFAVLIFCFTLAAVSTFLRIASKNVKHAILDGILSLCFLTLSFFIESNLLLVSLCLIPVFATIVSIKAYLSYKEEVYIIAIFYICIIGVIALALLFALWAALIF